MSEVQKTLIFCAFLPFLNDPDFFLEKPSCAFLAIIVLNLHAKKSLELFLRKTANQLSVLESTGKAGQSYEIILPLLLFLLPLKGLSVYTLIITRAILWDLATTVTGPKLGS